MCEQIDNRTHATSSINHRPRRFVHVEQVRGTRAPRFFAAAAFPLSLSLSNELCFSSFYTRIYKQGPEAQTLSLLPEWTIHSSVHVSRHVAAVRRVCMRHNCLAAPCALSLFEMYDHSRLARARSVAISLSVLCARARPSRLTVSLRFCTWVEKIYVYSASYIVRAVWKAVLSFWFRAFCRD